MTHLDNDGFGYLREKPCSSIYHGVIAPNNGISNKWRIDTGRRDAKGKPIYFKYDFYISERLAGWIAATVKDKRAEHGIQYINDDGNIAHDRSIIVNQDTLTLFANYNPGFQTPNFRYDMELESEFDKMYKTLTTRTVSDIRDEVFDALCDLSIIKSTELEDKEPNKVVNAILKFESSFIEFSCHMVEMGNSESETSLDYLEHVQYIIGELIKYTKNS